MYELKNGTARLVATLARYKDDTAAMQQLAAALNYDQEQLTQDIQALHDHHDLFDLWNSNAAAGYAAAAAVAADLNRQQTVRLMDAMQAAFENMTIEEAREYYEHSDL